MPLGANEITLSLFKSTFLSTGAKTSGINKTITFPVFFKLCLPKTCCAFFKEIKIKFHKQFHEKKNSLNKTCFSFHN